MKWRRKMIKALLGSMLLLGFATLTSAPAQADRWSSCRNRRAKLERKLDRDIYRHGFRSRQAERDRWDLRELERSCGGYGYRWRR